MYNKNIVETMEKFYLCTNLPTIALELDGNVIGLSGYNDKLTILFKKNNIAKLALKSLDEKIINATVNEVYCKTICCNREVLNYTAVAIDMKNPESGIYILGPHSCTQDNTMGIPYKPLCLIPYLISLLRNLEDDTSDCCMFKSNYSYHVSKALDYISTRYSENITLDDIVEYLNISKGYFCVLLKKDTGKTFTTILNEIRIEKSKGMLCEKNSSMLDIALSVGFNNQNYYNIVFKKITGITPSEYKNRH